MRHSNPLDAYDGVDGSVDPDEFDLIEAVDRLRYLGNELIYLSEAIGEYSGREKRELERKEYRLGRERHALSEQVEEVANLDDRPYSVAMTYSVFSWDADERLSKEVVAVDAREAVEKTVDNPEGPYRVLRVRDFETSFVKFE